MGRLTEADPGIAIIGVACRLPGGIRDLAALWQVFLDGVDVTGPVPAERWGPRFHHPDRNNPGTTYCATGAFLEDVATFDASFFGITAREARELDPQQRFLLETAWAAMENSGVPRREWESSRTGVYTGILGMDYALLHAKAAGVASIGPYYATGKEFSFGAGRIAYTFGLQGPCLMLNTACSSSLTAVHLAARSLESGECDMALAGGVNLMLAPELTVFMSKIEALSPRGLCRPFDASADGVVRGEGCVVIVLKRYTDALADGDHIWAVIKGSAVNHGGRGAGLTTPNAAAQETVVRAALASAGVAARDVDYVEAHCTGTPVGDPIEVTALQRVFGAARDASGPLFVGSHKANFGHLDSAAGLLGLLKAVLVSRHGVVPPQIGVERLNPCIDWNRSGLTVATEATPLPGTWRHVGVSAFGLSGSNAHVVLAAAPAPRPAAEPVPASPVLVVSGHTPQALAAQASAYRDRILTGSPEEMPDILYSAGARRTHHDYRLALVGATREQLADALTAHLAGEPTAGTATGDILLADAPPVVHVFSGQGSQWPGMGLDLYPAHPLVRDVLDECDAYIREFGGWRLLEEMGRAEGSRLSETRLAQPAIFALQLALSRLWSAWGMAPEAVVGHSMGEVAAACAAGAISVRNACHLIVHRGRIMQDASGTGRMAAVEMPADRVRTLLEPYGGEVCIATVNGPGSVVISGPANLIEDAAAMLRSAGAACHPLGVDYAFHSAAVRTHGDRFEELLNGFVPEAPSIPLLSSVLPDVDAPVVDASYWGRNVRDPVQFWPAVDRWLAMRDALFIEIGPHAVLSRPLRDALRKRGRRGPVVSSLSRGRPSMTTLAAALATLHTVGAPVDWAAVHGPGHRYTELPALELTGKRHWLAGVDPGSQGPDVASGDLRAEVRVFDGGGRLLATLGTAGARQELPSAAPRIAFPPTSTVDAIVKAPVKATVEPTVGAGAASGTGASAPRMADGHVPARPPEPAVRSPEQVVRKLSAIAAEVLGHASGSRLSRVRGFYELGFDSFTLVELIKRLRDEFGVELSASAGIEYPTIEGLADHVVAELMAGAGRAALSDRAGAPALSPDTYPVPDSGASATESIAIVGMSCRLPGADSVDAFWSLLSGGVDASSDIPRERWDAAELLTRGAAEPGTVVTARGSFLERVDQFDNGFFRVSSREARSMDPQQRIFLETAWEALEDAGLSPEALRGGRTGLYVGLNTTDYQHLVTRRAEDVDLYYGTGNSFSGTAGRLSYFLDVRGPSLAVDTACSSSLVAVHLACQSLRSGEADVAVAGGANVIVTPTVYLAMSAGGALSPDGRCKTFAASADGYGRGEGAGAVVLKALSRAMADGDRVYAVIRGSAVNHNGASGGLTVPSAEAQAEVIAAAMAQASVSAADVDYVEAHGTGTPLGDAVELTALDRALGNDRPVDRPLLVGSVKTNIGHLEAAAGIAGLIKAVLAMHHGEIPAHLHFQEPNGQVAWNRLQVRVARKSTPWPAPLPGRPRTAGVSAFGFTGTNAHVVISEPPAAGVPSRSSAARGRQFALAVSAASRPALGEAAGRLGRRLATAPDDMLADICYTAGARRAHLQHRLVVTGTSRAELLARLAAVRGMLSDGMTRDAVPTTGAWAGTARAGEPARLALVYGQEIAALPWARLDSEEPAFHDALDALEADSGRSIRQALRGGADDPLSMVAVQICLTATWRDHGVTPDAVAGQGIGEIAAAHAAGVLSSREALRAARGEPSVRASGPPLVPLHLASVARAGGGPANWTPSQATASGTWSRELAAALVTDGVEAVLDAGLGQTAGRLAELSRQDLSAVAHDPPLGPEALVAAAAELHVRGVRVSWPALLGGRGSVVSLPGYPWQRLRHWIDVPALPVPDRGAGIHPGLAPAFAPSDSRGTRYYPVRSAPATEPGWVGSATVTELVLAAAADVVGAGALRLRALRLAAPLTDAMDLRPDAGAQIAASCHDGGWSLRLVSGAGQDRAAAVIASAVAGRTTRPDAVDIAGLRARIAEPVPSEEPAGDALADLAGPCLGKLRQDRDGVERLVQITAGTDADERRGLPAGLLATAVRLLMSCRVPAGKELLAAERYAVRGIDEIRLYDSHRGDVLVHAVGANDREDGLVRVLAGDGRVLSELRGIRLAPADGFLVPDQVRDRLRERLYTIRWREVPETANRDITGRPAAWLIVPAAPDASTVAARLTAALRQRGAAAVAAAMPESAADWNDALCDDQGGGTPDAVVLVTAGMTARCRDPLACGQDPAVAVLLAARAVDAAAAPDRAPRLWVVTAGAHTPVRPATVDPPQAAAATLARVLAMEVTRVWGGLVDLDPRDLADSPAEAGPYLATADRLLTAATATATAATATATADADPADPAAATADDADAVEDEVCLRGSAWYAPRLARGEPPPHVPPPLRCRPDAWYALVGDLTAANRPFAELLVRHGARRIILVRDGAEGEPASRESAVSSDPLPGVEFATVRIGRDRPTGDLDDALRGEPLAGVVIAPFAIPARPLGETAEDHLVSALFLADLAERVERSVSGRTLDFFWVSGSAAAAWGCVGMAAAAVAEGALSAIAHAREAAGRPVTVIRWMPRGDTQELSRRDRMLMEDSGLQPLDAGDLTEAAGILLPSGYRDVCVARIEEDRYAVTCRARLDRAFLEALGRPAAGEAEVPSAPMADELLALSPELRAGRMLNFVLGQVSEVLGTDSGSDIDPDQGFFDLGMDSVMSLSLKARLDRGLGGDLPATLTFEHPTTRALARHLLDELRMTSGRPDSADGLEELSDDEIVSRLLASVARSEELLRERD